MIRKLPFLVLLSLFSNLAYAQPNWRNTGAILPAHYARDVLRQCSRPAPQGVTGYWEPLPAEIDMLELDLGRFVDAGGVPPLISFSASNPGALYGTPAITIPM